VVIIEENNRFDYLVKNKNNLRAVVYENELTSIS